MIGVLWLLLIVGIIFVGAIVAILLSKKFVKSEENRIYKSSQEKILLIENNGKNVDLIVENINKINEKKPIKFNIKGRIE